MKNLLVFVLFSLSIAMGSFWMLQSEARQDLLEKSAVHLTCWSTAPDRPFDRARFLIGSNNEGYAWLTESPEHRPIETKIRRDKNGSFGFVYNQQELTAHFDKEAFSSAGRMTRVELNLAADQSFHLDCRKSIQTEKSASSHRATGLDQVDQEAELRSQVSENI